MKNKICIILIILTILFYSFSTWAYFLQQKQQEIYNEAKESFLGLYVNAEEEVPVKNITSVDVDNTREKVSLIGYKYTDQKDNMNRKLDLLNDYLKLNEEINYCFDNDLLKSSVSKDQIYEIKDKFNELDSAYKEILNDKIISMMNQYESILKLNNAVNNLFSDNSRLEIVKDITYKQYNEVKNLLYTVKQPDIIEKENEDLNRVKKELDRREEERKKKILKAWTKLNVPYISQNYEKVYNGCEAASLLMALKYKGYLKNVTLTKYAEIIPKSTDPYLGFVNSIYDVEPRNVVHWIAPEALAKFGRETSENSQVIDMTGSSLSELNKEVESGNPVIIYLTSNLKKPKTKTNGITGNLHVLLLTGYNSITNEQIITDPWTRANNTKTWQISKSELEKIYNEVGKMAVVVR